MTASMFPSADDERIAALTALLLLFAERGADRVLTAACCSLLARLGGDHPEPVAAGVATFLERLQRDGMDAHAFDDVLFGLSHVGVACAAARIPE